MSAAEGRPTGPAAAAGSGPRVLVNALSLVHGGGRTYVLNLVRELNRDPRGFRFTLLTARGRLAPEDTGGLPLAEVFVPSRPRWLGVAWRVLYELLVLPIRSRDYDLVYCLADVSSPLAIRPTVVALRNLNIYDRRFYDTLRLRTLERLARLGVRRARRIVFPSQGAAEVIGKRVGVAKDRVAVVPHGISVEAFGVDTPGLGEGRPYVFTASSLERHKNLEVLLRSLLHVEDPKLELWIAGPRTMDPEHADYLEQTARNLRIEQRVRFLGLVPYREMLAFYRGARAFVFPSVLETFGHPLLESMLARAPLVAADIPVFREIAGDAALYFQPDDPVALAEAIDRVEKDPVATRARLDSGRTRAEAYSWRRSVDDLCAVFREVLDENRSR